MELLQKLYSIHSPSGAEKPMRKFIRKWVTNNVEGIELHYDSVGNMYFTKGNCDTYPCVVAHLDQVQDTHSKDFTTFIHKGEIYGWSPSSGKQEGLGADDKNGIWVALKCLQRFDAIKVAFFNSEEIGCVGSASAELPFFKDCRFIIQPDRRGAHDLITKISYSDICSEEFKSDLDADLYGYVETSGFMTDVLELSERGVGLSCINVSCGYYSPHTDQETTNISDLVNCYNFVAHIIEKCQRVYPFEYERYSSYKSYGINSGGYYSRGRYSSTKYCGRYYDDDYYNSYYDDCYGGYYDDYYTQQYTNNNEPYIPNVEEYERLDVWLDDLIGWNFEDYYPEDLWKYVEDLLEGVATKADFLEAAEKKWNEYYNSL